MNQEPETDGYKWKCPQCENLNPMKLWTCGHCKVYSRPQPKGGQADAFGRNPKLCHFVSANCRQCPLPRAGSNEIGSGKPEWCAGHEKNKSGPDAELVYEDAVANYDAIMARMKGSFHNDPVGWWEREGRQQHEDWKKKQADQQKKEQQEREERERLLKLDAEALAERAAIQAENQAQP